MTFSVSNNVNSALISGLNGMQSASNNITQSSVAIAQQQAQQRDTTDVLADTARQQLAQPGQLLSGLSGGDSLTDNLVSLSVNLTNFQASAKVVETADKSIGRLIDELV